MGRVFHSVMTAMFLWLSCFLEVLRCLIWVYTIFKRPFCVCVVGGGGGRGRRDRHKWVDKLFSCAGCSYIYCTYMARRHFFLIAGFISKADMYWDSAVQVGLAYLYKVGPWWLELSGVLIFCQSHVASTCIENTKYSGLVISTSLISNNRLSRSENLVPA